MKIIVAGLESSGSTAVWQATTQITQRNVEKHHGFKLVNGYHLVPIRNPRDILASFYRREIFGRPKDIDAYFIGSLEYLKPRFKAVANYCDREDSLFIKYEEWVNNEEKLVDKIADFLHYDLEDWQRTHIVDYISLDSNKNRSEKMSSHANYDPQTHIHGRHITSYGALDTWQTIFDELRPKTVELIEAELDKHDYLK
jgi:hypothetical protein